MDAYQVVPIFIALLSGGLAVFMFTGRPTMLKCSKCDKCSDAEYTRPKRIIKKRTLCALECCADQSEDFRRPSVISKSNSLKTTTSTESAKDADQQSSNITKALLESPGIKPIW